MRPAKFVVPAAAAIIACANVAAQDGSGSSEPRFEVASVKPAEDRGMRYRADPGQFSGQMPLIEFVSRAYQIPTFRILGPDWIRRDWFSIAARIPAEGMSR